MNRLQLPELKHPIPSCMQALVGDLEKLRKHLKMSSWLMLGGSWGVALTLAYAQKHPDR